MRLQLFGSLGSKTSYVVLNTKTIAYLGDVKSAHYSIASFSRFQEHSRNRLQTYSQRYRKNVWLWLDMICCPQYQCITSQTLVTVSYQHNEIAFIWTILLNCRVVCSALLLPSVYFQLIKLSFFCYRRLSLC